jgi:hypothetical protein
MNGFDNGNGSSDNDDYITMIITKSTAMMVLIFGNSDYDYDSSDDFSTTFL